MTSKRLARLVRLKKLAEDARATELAEQRQSLAKAEENLERTHNAMDAAAPSETVLSAPELLSIAHYQEHLSRQARTQEDEIRSRVAVVRDAEEAVRSAWTDRRSMQSVHDRVTERESAEDRRKEQLAMSEIALNRSRRKS